jgi:uncharacterized protein
MRIEHEDGRRFYMATGAGEAELTYAMPVEGVLDLKHTFVPEQERHHGLGGLLVEHAFRHARDQGYVVRASCPFVRAWARERPEYQELLER